MSDNPYLKKLKAFNPREDLKVNETYHLESSQDDPIASLQDTEEESDSRGKEWANYKTSAPIEAGLLLWNRGSENILIAVNRKGKAYFFKLGANDFQLVKTMQFAGPVISKPVLSDGILYSLSRLGMIQAVKLPNLEKEEKEKSVLWQKKMPKGILTEGLATGKMLLVSCLNGIFAFEAYYQDDKNYSIGSLLWRYPLNGVVSSPQMDEGLIYVGSEDKNLYAFDYGGRQANINWKFDAGAAVRMKAFPAKRRDLLLFGNQEGKLFCLNKRNGKLFWVFRTGAAINSDIVSSLEGNNEYFYFGTDSGTMYCINHLGKKIWEYQTNGRIRTEALLHKDKIYFGSEDNQFYALSAKTGEPLFQYATDGNINGAPLIYEGKIFFASTDSFVYALNL